MFFEYDSYAYYLCVQPVDMRSGAHRLSQIVVAQMSQDPLSKKMLLFVGKNRKAVKVLVWDRNGWWLLYKKLYAKGTFAWPESEEAALQITAVQIRQFLSGENCWRRFPVLYGSVD